MINWFSGYADLLLFGFGILKIVLAFLFFWIYDRGEGGTVLFSQNIFRFFENIFDRIIETIYDIGEGGTRLVLKSLLNFWLTPPPSSIVSFQYRVGKLILKKSEKKLVQRGIADRLYIEGKILGCLLWEIEKVKVF